MTIYQQLIIIIIIIIIVIIITIIIIINKQTKQNISNLNGAVTKTYVNWLVCSGFRNEYRSHPALDFNGSVGRCKATTLVSLSLTSERISTTNLLS